MIKFSHCDLPRSPLGSGDVKRALEPHNTHPWLESKGCMAVPQRIKRGITLWSSNSTSRCIQKEMKTETQMDTCATMFITALFATAKWWKNPMSINRWINTQSLVYTHNGMLFRLNKKWNSDKCYNMNNFEDIILSKTSQIWKEKF